MNKNMKFVLVVAGIGVAVALVFNVLHKSYTSNTSYKSNKLSVFSSSASPIIPLGLSVAEAASLSKGIQLNESNIAITGPRGERVNGNVDLNLKPQNNGEYGLVVNPKNEQAFRPGKYSVSANIQTKSGIRHIEQDFLWGVLAINPNKSVYRPGETAKLALAVLDERGMMVCDAAVTLQVRKSESQKVTSLTTENGTIRVNDECRQKRVTERPDYETEYTTKDPGIYQMTLTATTKNGTYTIEDYFEVKESVPFDIERITATRIYPVHEYPVTIKVITDQDFTGMVTETVPEFFGIQVESPKSKVESNNKTKTIVWNVDWKAGETYELSYIYKSPEISPQFYLLGALEIRGNQGDRGDGVGFREARQWQIAVDAIAYVQSTLQAQAASTTNGVAFTSNNTSGNLIIASVTWNSGTITASIADSAGNSYSTAVGPTVVGLRSMQTWYAQNIASGANTVTVTFSDAATSVLMIHEYSGLALTGSLDQTSANSGTSTACDSGSVTTTYADELIYGVCGVASASITKGASYTQREYRTNAMMSEDKIVSSTGSYSADFTVGSSVAWFAHIATFKAAIVANSPTITSVTDTPDPTNPGRSVTFSTSWTDSDSTTVKVKVCKSSTLSSQNCSDGSWASSTVFTSQTPENLVYDIVGGDAGTTRSYFVHSCDDGGTCTSTSTAGTFTVNTVSNVPNVKFR